jgi:hypothetical protein
MLRPNTSISSELTPPPLISLSVARCCLRMNGRFAPEAAGRRLIVLYCSTCLVGLRRWSSGQRLWDISCLALGVADRRECM